jgi:hypothetical protein
MEHDLHCVSKRYDMYIVIPRFKGGGRGGR